MPSELRSADVIGRHAYDLSGGYLGRVADVVVTRDADGGWRLAEVLVTRRLWVRLFGYERDAQTGPWPLEALARRLVRRHVAVVRWAEVRIGEPDDPA